MLELNNQEIKYIRNAWRSAYDRLVFTDLNQKDLEVMTQAMTWLSTQFIHLDSN